MKAIVIHAARDLRIEDQPIGEPGADELLIDIAVGGICGSDLHYYSHGGFGTVRLREPMILGHEVSGFVSKISPDVTGFSMGQLVAISPSRSCGSCKYCLEGQQNQCLNMEFYGSAMPFPHIQGAFRQQIVAKAEHCFPADGLTAGEAAMAEPLAVCLHAIRRAESLVGKRVLVTGCGPIGVLTILAARRAGAVEIVATDLTDFTLEVAQKAGADRVLNVRTSPESLSKYQHEKGTFDVMFECSGSALALGAGITTMRPRGIVVQVGMSGNMDIPMQAITTKELDLRGTFRFHEEFKTAVVLMQKGLVQVDQLITQTMKLNDAIAAFDLAGDRSKAMKVQIDFCE